LQAGKSSEHIIGATVTVSEGMSKLLKRALGQLSIRSKRGFLLEDSYFCVSMSSSIDSLMQAQSGALQSQIDMAVLKKQLNASKAQGEAALRLLESAAQLNRVNGKGTAFDALG
jgi:hypothetical protein